MIQENLAKALADEKYSKKRITRCKDSHCITTFSSPTE
jgi:hypothetical protein